MFFAQLAAHILKIIMSGNDDDDSSTGSAWSWTPHEPEDKASSDDEAMGEEWMEKGWC